MVTVGLYYDVLPGKAPLFVEKFQAVLALLGTMPGHTSSYLYQRVDDPDSFAILSEWSDPDAFYSFLRSDAFRQTADWGREQVLRAVPRHKIYPRAEDIGPPSRSAH
ncbi:MAG: antibiotic biosynthesis monooxygenase [Isosphaeraceae bacterium]|nr:antibiotic biosynthesis monooxygenase [Isosphaeraceae bacterium]